MYSPLKRTHLTAAPWPCSTPIQELWRMVGRAPGSVICTCHILSVQSRDPLTQLQKYITTFADNNNTIRLCLHAVPQRETPNSGRMSMQGRFDSTVRQIPHAESSIRGSAYQYGTFHVGSPYATSVTKKGKYALRTKAL